MTTQPSLHLEHDGKLLLVDSKGEGPCIPVKGRQACSSEEGWLYRLPTQSEAEALGVPWVERRRLVISLGEEDYTVIKGMPNIAWPENWAWKDDVISDSAVHPLARESVYRSLHRLVSKVIIQDEEGFILMAKVKRGHFLGHWGLPGGYLEHDEHPRTGAVRETLEELGVEISISDPLGEGGPSTKPTVSPCAGCVSEEHWSIVSQNIFTDEGISFVSFTFRTKVEREKMSFKLKEDEIEEIGWFSPADAVAHAVSWFDITAIDALT